MYCFNKMPAAPRRSLWVGCIAVFAMFTACRSGKTRFVPLDAGTTGIDFSNTIIERDTQNILDMEFVYNGGGIAVGDLNGDGWEDLYFTGNQVDNKLYLNRGNFKFEEVTATAGVGKKNPYQWSSGINIVDLNLDGRLDIYVCNTSSPSADQRRNFLFVNQGNDARGIPHFKEMGREYGVDDPSHSSHAQFFDYDNDGDLDLFVGVNLIYKMYPNQFITRVGDGSAPTRDNLYRNDWNDTLGHPVFTDVSVPAGIVWEGYSHSTLICDFNDDGWQDIYVSNDYQSNDLIYINNGNGTFTNRAADIFKHQAFSSMGSDIGDLDNDGKADFFMTEMQPYYNKRKKLFQGGSNYQTYLYTEQFKYEYQYTRNMLQRNAGINPATGLPVFSELGMYAGVQETDWSWAPLFADYDNDGLRDLYVTNGFPRDVTDHDYAEFNKTVASTLLSKQEIYNKIPQVKSPNFMFKNKGDCSFEDVTNPWGLHIPSFTNGAVYADLDKDGDLDLVTNNISDKAFVFKNQSELFKETPVHYLRVLLKGPAKNPDAFGARVEVFAGGIRQTAYLLSGRGYLSKPENTQHFGLGSAATVDSVRVIWPDRRCTTLKQVAADQVLTVGYQADAPLLPSASLSPGLFTEAATEVGLAWKDEENDYIDFNFQRTLPHKFSQYGPAIAVGDANGDGRDDVFMGGSSRFEEQWFFQQANGRFQRTPVAYKTDESKREEDAGILLFDADNDGDNDLYIARGSGQHPAGDSLYQDILCVNDGKGHFAIQPAALPREHANGSCVKAADIDGDGDLDLFVGSRVLPKSYPLPDRCYLLRNDSQGKDAPRFTDATEQICPGLAKPGLISDALWTDFNNDQQPDLILAGEWMSLRFYQNNGGKLEDITEKTGLSAQTGWWNSLAAADLDNDGDMDYIAGNAGLNLYFRCTEQEPLHLYGKDFDNNGAVDPFLSCYWKDSLGAKHEYFYHPREDVVKQMPPFRKKFNTYGTYGAATVQDIFSKKELEGALVLDAKCMYTSVVENRGNGQFELHYLPAAAQWAPIYGILPYDVDDDGRLDLLLTGNDFGMELQQGRADAFNGLVLRNKGAWAFEPVETDKSRFWVPQDARGIVSLVAGAPQQEFVAAVQNRADLKVFKARALPGNAMPMPREAVKALLTLSDGTTRMTEWYHGSGFMAQKSRQLTLGKNVRSVKLLDRQGKTLKMIETGVATPPSK